VDIKFNCAGCGTHIVIDEAGAGLAVQCPRCGQALTVPTASAAESAAGKPGLPLDFGEIIQSAIHAAAQDIEAGILDDDQKLDAHFRAQSPEMLAASFGKANARAFLEGKMSGNELLNSGFKIAPGELAELLSEMETIGKCRKNPD